MSRRNCPNERDISIKNVAWGLHLNETERFPTNAAHAVISVRPEAEGALGDLDALVEDIQTSRNMMLTEQINNRVEKAAAIACQNCSGVVVDLSSGQMYCGREVPQEVAETNKRLQAE